MDSRATRIAVALTALMLGLEGAPARAHEPCLNVTDCATAKASIPSMTALTLRDSQCLTRTFPGEDRVADMPNTSIEFTQGGQTAEPVLVTFIGNWPEPTGPDLPQGSEPAGALIFLEIDGDRPDPISNGGVLVHAGTTSFNNGTHGFTFVTEPIPPGVHTAKMLWSNNLLTGTGTICVFERSLVIQHR